MTEVEKSDLTAENVEAIATAWMLSITDDQLRQLKYIFTEEQYDSFAKTVVLVRKEAAL